MFKMGDDAFSPLLTVALGALGAAVLLLGPVVARWRREAQRRLAGVRAAPAMTRVAYPETTPTPGSTAWGRGMATELALHRDYRASEAMASSGLKVRGLGEYLATLVPAGGGEGGLSDDLQAAVGKALLNALGPGLGTLLLPSLGALPSAAGGYAAAAVSSIAAFGGIDAEEARLAHARSTLPAAVVRAMGGTSLMTMAGAADVHATVQAALARAAAKDAGDREGAEERVPTSVEKVVHRGETAATTFPAEAVPNPFVVARDFRPAIAALEATLAAEEEGRPYDPDDRQAPTPTPVDEKTLPGLCWGACGIPLTMTRRNILEGRLLCILLNRLASNDIRKEFPDDGGGDFAVQVDTDTPVLLRPEDLVRALAATDGCTAACRVASRTTTFGVALCVAEPDGTYSHVPVGMPIRSGMRCGPDGDAVPVYLPHSSVDLEIRGMPGSDSDRLLVQYYHDSTGFAGWNNGHYPDAPWALDGTGRDVDCFKAVRMAGFHAAVTNSTAERYGVPVGGYALFGTCNDSVGIVEAAAAGDGKTGVYPLQGVGAWHMDVIRRAKEYVTREAGKAQGRSLDFAGDLQKFYRAVVDLPNDVFPTLGTMDDGARRLIATTPDVPLFQAMEDGKKMAHALRKELNDLKGA